MTILNDAPYWIALAHLPEWRTEKINKLIIDILINKNKTFTDFFSSNEDGWKSEFLLNEKEISDLIKARSDLPALSFLAESLYNQGFEIIPINSPEYSPTLKNNLKTKLSPPLLYLKGNKQLLHEPSVAIVGSRNAGEKSLVFTENLAREFAKNYKVVVSGFAKGVDKMALDASIKYNGHSIIVLPQGILSSSREFQKYYPQIIAGDVLVVSTFPPKVPWSVGLAMARNAYIYGLAEEIYVAEADSKGGTWSGAIDGLKKGRKVYVRLPESDENIANELLIQKGAIPIDFSGKPIVQDKLSEVQIAEHHKISPPDMENRIKEILKFYVLTAKEIKEVLNLDWDTRKLSDYLKTTDFIVMEKTKKGLKFRLKDYNSQENTLFK